MLRAAIENGTLERKIDPQTGLNPGLAYQFDLQLDNTSPKLAPLIPLDSSGKPVEFARPGSTIHLDARAEDRDGDSLTYNWLLADGNGTLDATDQPSVEWKLPGKNGRYAVTAIVADGKGGYAQSYFSFRVSTGGVRFSGDVVDPQGAPVAGAQVEVNGRSVNTNANGRFQIELLPSDRYVFNIRKTGFGLTSQVYPAGVTDGVWALRRAQVFTVDPTRPIRLQQRRTQTDCPGTARRRDQLGRSRVSPTIFSPVWCNGRMGRAMPFRLPNRAGAIQNPSAACSTNSPASTLSSPASWRTSPSLRPNGQREFEHRCGPGIAVEIPANAFVDRNGNLPTGTVDVALSTVDLDTPQQMPGDYSSVNPDGRTLFMESYGAGSIDIRAGTTRLALKPNTAAKITIPVDPAQLAAGAPLPTTIPLLSYDEARGVWVEEGSLELAGDVYIGKVTHFSSLNADLQKTDQSCVAVHSGPGLPAMYTIEVTLPPKTPGAAPSVRSFPIDNSSSSEHVIYNLPNDVNIVLVPIVAGTKPDGSAGDVPAGIFVVNTGGPQTAASNLPPGPPYYNTDADGNPIGPCLTRVDLANLPVQGAPDPPYEFLQGLDVQSTNLTELQASDPIVASAILSASEAYYDLADPRGLRRDLLDFLDRNRFGQPLNIAGGELEASAAYANSGDLGFGRNMHCRRNLASDGAFDLACYVTNYGDYLTPDAQDAADAASQNAAAEVATVTMEYTRVENPPGDPLEFPDNSRTVKFYVYKNALASPTHSGQGNGPRHQRQPRRRRRTPGTAVVHRLPWRRLRQRTGRSG